MKDTIQYIHSDTFVHFLHKDFPILFTGLDSHFSEISFDSNRSVCSIGQLERSSSLVKSPAFQEIQSSPNLKLESKDKNQKSKDKNQNYKTENANEQVDSLNKSEKKRHFKNNEFIFRTLLHRRHPETDKQLLDILDSVLIESPERTSFHRILNHRMKKWKFFEE